MGIIDIVMQRQKWEMTFREGDIEGGWSAENLVKEQSYGQCNQSGHY